MSDLNLRNQKTDYKGRSLLLNVIGILLNILGVIFIVKGYHESSADGGLVLKIAGLLLIVGTLFGMVLLKGLFLFSYVSRVFVGGLFIVSGLVKANDPWGFAFKLEEYFSPAGLAADFGFFEWFHPYVLELSIIICIIEIILGAALILGGKIKLASWSLVGMMIFFTWLTWYTADCNTKQELAMQLGTEFSRDCVTDCGCFGDALRGSVGRSLTPLESFWKDIVLFYFVIIIFVNQRKTELNTVKENWVMVPASMLVIIFFSWVFGWIFPIFFALFVLLGSFVIGRINIGKMGKAWKMALFVGLSAFLFSTYTSMYLPIKDYRPYAIGKNIIDQMSNGVAEESEFQWIYMNKKTGKEEIFATDDYLIYGDTSKYKYVDRIKTVLKAGVDASITDFVASINFENLGEAEKAIPYVDSLIKADYDFYYEEKMVVKSIDGYFDTIAVMDYDTLYYPDSIYTTQAPYVTLSDPSSPWLVDMTPYILAAEHIFLMTIRDIENINENAMEDLKNVLAGAKENNIPFFVLSPASEEQIQTFKSKFDFDATFLAFDGTEVKILVRSNPGLLLLNKATIVDKWPSRSIPDFGSIFEDYIQGK